MNPRNIPTDFPLNRDPDEQLFNLDLGDFHQKWMILFLSCFLSCMMTRAQTNLDISLGLSNQDDYNSQIAMHHAFSERLQFGLEFQYGVPQYRFIETKELREGYIITTSIPGVFLLQNSEKIQLYGIGRLGLRFQGIIDPDGNDMRDSTFNSTALIYEFGLLSSFKASEKVSMQAGMTFPSSYELSPLSLAEYTWVKLHFGSSITLNRLILYSHTNIGAAFGAMGDTYKYIWSTELGIRIPLKENKNSLFRLIQTSF